MNLIRYILTRLYQIFIKKNHPMKSNLTLHEKDLIISACKHILEGKPLNLVINIDNTNSIKTKFRKIMDNLSELSAAVERETSIDQSVLTLIQGFAQKLEEAGTDKAKLKALTAQMNANADALAAAVAANTPATPAPETPVDETPVEPPVDAPPTDEPQ